ncbi:glycosyltransferase [Alteromonas sp. 1_MG-2023]|uniref:glycosyltransferase n=1 Tax=Alteromonas sp. 1_MG-2023 TaxID=3062669 RepID=UPI0026E46196|nr:glycosyltransferase [Alteromonas sp. 1_MG-2023]MDO6567786.1 glycosyltransferase [Alteromonas sp. 1_MG-2023]
MSLKILHIELGRNLYGGAKQVVYLLDSLNRQFEYKNHLICPDDSELAKKPITGCHMHTIAYRGETDLFSVKRMVNIARKIKADVIHVHSRRGADVFGAMVAKITGIPAICTRRVDNAESLFATYKYSQFAAVASISEGVFNVVSHHCEAVKHQAVIHSSVDFNEFSTPGDRAWLNETFSIPSDHVVIANFAQLIARKGQADIILAMEKVAKDNPKVTCLLFGKGNLKESYQALIERHLLTDHVKLCGFTDQVSKILPSVDIVVHPAYAEGLGVILLQAGACKRAVVSTPVGGIPEIIEHDKTGLMVTPGNIDDIADALITLVNDEGSRDTLGKHLYQHVKAHFSTKEMALRYSELYLAVTGSE